MAVRVCDLTCCCWTCCWAGVLCRGGGVCGLWSCEGLWSDLLLLDGLLGRRALQGGGSLWSVEL